MVSRFFHHRLPSPCVAILLGLASLLFCVSIPQVFAAAGIYQPINYQGKLTTTAGASIANGQYNMRFKIFTGATLGSPVWTEIWNEGSQRVTATGGLFTVALGSLTSLDTVDFNTDSLYLQLEFDPGNDGTYEEIFAPRRRFSAVPYAHNARRLEGLGASQFLRSDIMNSTMSGDLIEGNQIIANTSFSGSKITIMRGAASYFLGNIGIGTGTGLEARTTIATEDSFNNDALRINSDETTAGQNLFKIISDVTSANNTVFRIQADGSTFSDNAYSSSGADYAEWFFSNDSLKPGEVVCIDVFQNNSVRRCERSGDVNVMGIVSTNPAFIGNTISGADGLPVPGHYLIGLIGQVPAIVSLENGTILPGDSLTASSIAGVARKAKAGESTVGVALEKYDGSQSTDRINVLISRKNQSVTVENVEAHVLESIAAMNISDTVKQMVQTSVENAKLDDRIASLLTASVENLHLSARIEEGIASYMTASGQRLIASRMEPMDAQLTQLIGTSALLSLRLSDAEERLSNLAHSLTVLQAFSGSTFTMNTIHSETLMSSTIDTETLAVKGLLKLSGRAELGALTLSGSTVTIGSITASGALRVIGDVTIDGILTVEKDVHIKGELILSKKQAGYAIIPLSGTSVTVRFSEPMIGKPIITATPEVPVLYAVRNASATGFTLLIQEKATEDIRFSFIALSAEDPDTIRGTVGTEDPYVMYPFPINEKGQPVSSNMIWNACIRGEVITLGGEPVSCSRYHNESVWEHPDLHISFIYKPNHEPPILTLPDHYVKTIVADDGINTQNDTTHTAAPLLENNADTTPHQSDTTPESTAIESTEALNIDATTDNPSHDVTLPSVEESTETPVVPSNQDSTENTTSATLESASEMPSDPVSESSSVTELLNTEGLEPITE